MASMTVRPGQTLWSIARSRHTSVADLLALNPAVRDPGRIETGQILEVPPTSASEILEQAVRRAAAPLRQGARPGPPRAASPALVARNLPGGSGVRRWAPAIASASRSTGVSPRLIAAVMAEESHGNPRLRSSAGAIGPMQLLRQTAAHFRVNPYNPVQNILGGARYLRALLARFHGNLELALAAYNAGPGAVRRFGGIPPYRQTRRYVSQILGTLS